MKVQSILVTGTDLVGKTTLIDQLVPYLRDRGHKIIQNKDDLHKTEVMKLARELLEKENTVNLLQINGILFLTFLIDSLHFKPDPTAIIIQDSYACRTAAFARAFDLKVLTSLFQEYREKFFSFDVTIHLSATIEVKKKRLLQVESPNRQDFLLETEPERVRLMDEFLQSIVQSDKNYFHIDTSDLTIPQVFNVVLNNLEEYLN